MQPGLPTLPEAIPGDFVSHCNVISIHQADLVKIYMIAFNDLLETNASSSIRRPILENWQPNGVNISPEEVGLPHQEREFWSKVVFHTSNTTYCAEHFVKCPFQEEFSQVPI